MSFRIKNLPKIGNQTIRAFTVRSIEELKNLGVIKLRKGLTLNQAAKKIGIKKGRLTDLGITKNGINFSSLETALKKSIPEEIKLRREQKTADNVIAAILGRLGREDIVFGPFNIITTMEKSFLSIEEISFLLAAYTKLLNFSSIPGQALFIVKAIGKKCSISHIKDPEKHESLAKIAEKLYRGDILGLVEFIANVAEKLYSGDIYNQSIFVVKAAKVLYPKNISQQLKFIVKIINKLYKDISNRMKFIKHVIEESYHDIPNRATLVVRMAKEFHAKNIKGQRAFIVKAIQVLTATDDETDSTYTEKQIDLLNKAAEILKIAPEELIVEFFSVQK